MGKFSDISDFDNEQIDIARHLEMNISELAKSVA